MQQKVDILIDLLNKSGLKLSQKQLAFNIVADIVSKYNVNEAKYHQRIKQDNKIKTDFIDYYDSVFCLLYMQGINETDIMSLNYKYCEWIKENIDSLKSLTFHAIEQLELNLLFYESSYNGKLPESVKSLKDFILEQLEIKEENYNEALKAALKQFTKDHITTDIIRIGWIKEVNGRIKIKKT
jgi:hypothetical protein